MLYLGIDIGKRNHVASLIDENSKILFKAFSLSNTLNEAKSLLKKLSLHLSNKAMLKSEWKQPDIIGCRYTRF